MLLFICLLNLSINTKNLSNLFLSEKFLSATIFEKSMNIPDDCILNLNILRSKMLLLKVICFYKFQSSFNTQMRDTSYKILDARTINLPECVKTMMLYRSTEDVIEFP